MKRCPLCQQTFEDTMKFCRTDGTALESLDTAPTVILSHRTDGSRESRAAAQTIPLTEPAVDQAPTVRITAADLIPETRYAKSGEINIAYQVLGAGPIDLIYVPGWVSHLEYGWEEPLLARFYRKMASFSRLILFDKRGTGLSDQSNNFPTLEQRMDDVRAVMEAVGSERAVIFGMSEGGNMAMLFAATYPERTIALITFGVFAKRVYDPEYPWAPTPEQRQKFYDALENEWGGPVGVEDLAPSMAHDERFRHWWATYQRRSASPRAVMTLAKHNTQIDVRHVLPAIRVPTLVLHRTNDLDCNIEEGRYIAARIPNAKFVELPGEDHIPFVGDQDAILNQVKSFVENLQVTDKVDSVLATVLSIEALLKPVNNERPGKASNRFHTLAKRETEWFKGRVSEVNENEFCAIFDGPIRAIRCAGAIRNSALELGIEIKAGLHTGLCELRGDRASGAPVEISKRVANQAALGEVLLTNGVMDLVSGSGVAFTDRGTCNIPGVAEDCRLFAPV
jgi:pimeloyl-ACP methyl ester carboxylesterase